MPNLPTFDKELSWLSFNHRVLQEAMDKSNPIIERARFISFYSSNRDEFYRVRVFDIRRRVVLHREVGAEPEVHRLLRQIQRRTVELNLEFEFAYQDIIRGLR